VLLDFLICPRLRSASQLIPKGLAFHRPPSPFCNLGFCEPNCLASCFACVSLRNRPPCMRMVLCFLDCFRWNSTGWLLDPLRGLKSSSVCIIFSIFLLPPESTFARQLQTFRMSQSPLLLSERRPPDVRYATARSRFKLSGLWTTSAFPISQALFLYPLHLPSLLDITGLSGRRTLSSFSFICGALPMATPALVFSPHSSRRFLCCFATSR